MNRQSSKIYTFFLLVMALFVFTPMQAQQGNGQGKAKQELKGKERAAQAKGKEVRANAENAVGQAADKGEAVAEDAVNTAKEVGEEVEGKVRGHQKGNGKNHENHGHNKSDDHGQLGEGHEKPNKPVGDGDHVDNDDMEGDKKGKGHAYGKNKGEMSGREFGQARAEAARSRNAEHKKAVQEEIEQGAEVSTQAKSRIEKAQEALETAKASGTLSDEEISKREAVIKNAADKLKALESSIEVAKERNKSND